MSVGAVHPEPKPAAARASADAASLGADVANPSAAELAELIGAFNEVTARLQETHQSLRAQVARLEAELRDANEQLRRSERLAALGEMAAGIAHEVRNPLGSIRLYASMLAQDLTDRPPLRDTALKIDAAVRGLDAVVGDVLTFARQITPQFVQTTAQELFDDAVVSCAACLEAGGIDLERPDHQRSPVSLWCDPSLVRLALVNVLRNAAEAIAERPGVGERRIVLDTTRSRVRDKRGEVRSMIALRVRDTGPGVREDVVRRMFNPFFTTRHTGAGLGLAIVHRIVDAHDGRVQVSNAPTSGITAEDAAGDYSGGDSGGAIVEILLPAERSAAHNPNHQETPSP